MLFAISDPEISGAFITVNAGSLTPKLGFTLSYTTTTTPDNAAHMPVRDIPGLGKPVEPTRWEEYYELQPGAVSGRYGVLAQINNSLVNHRVMLVGKRRWNANNNSTLIIDKPDSGLLQGFLGDSQSFLAIFADSNLGDKLTKDLLRAFDALKHPAVRVVDSGIYLLYAPDIDETFYPHHASFNTHTVATFTQFGLNLNFRLADTVLVAYGLSVDTTVETTYLDEDGHVVMPNFFSWLARY